MNSHEAIRSSRAASGSDRVMFCQQCGSPTEEREIGGTMRPVCTAVDCGAVTWLDPKVAVAVVIERDGRILLGQRARHTRAPGTWSFPAGFVDRGEATDAAAIREVHEETGLTVTLGPVLGVYSEAGDPVVLIVYPAVDVSGDPSPDDDLSALDWFAPDDLATLNLAFPHDISILNAWQEWQAGRWRVLRAIS